LKKLHIVGKAYSNDWFELDLSDDEISLKPYIEVAPYHHVRYGLRMGDDGLDGLGIKNGDFLLISDSSTEPIYLKPVVVRKEGQFIIRIAYNVNPVECTLTTAGDIYPAMTIPSENIRIIGVLSGVIDGTTHLKQLFVDENDCSDR